MVSPLELYEGSLNVLEQQSNSNTSQDLKMAVRGIFERKNNDLKMYYFSDCKTCFLIENIILSGLNLFFIESGVKKSSCANTAFNFI